MVKRVIILAVIVFFVSTTGVVALTDVSANSAILIESSTLQSVFEKNADQRVGMASTTKIMTALVAIESVPLDKVVTVSQNAAGVEGSSIYLAVNEKISIRELLYGLMLSSGNDAAVAIAEGVAGNVNAFVKLMNKKAKELKLYNTSYANPNGLDSEENYTTARELAMLSAYALKNSEFKKIVSTKVQTVSLYGVKNGRRLVNHNKMLFNYEGCIGVKTGFTKSIGRCLVSAAEKNDITLIAVTLNAPDDWRDHTNMLDYGFSFLKKEQLEEKNAVSVKIPVAGTSKSIEIRNLNDIYGIFHGDSENIRRIIEAPRFLMNTVKMGAICGSVKYYDGNNLCASEPLCAISVENSGKRGNVIVKFFKKISGLFNAFKD